MKPTVLITLAVLFLSACQTNTAPPTSSAEPTLPTSTPEAPVSATPTPVAAASAIPTETGPKADDKTIVTENEHKYEYFYNEELGNLRTLGAYSILDFDNNNYGQVTLKISDKVKGERSLLSLTFKDNVDHASEYLASTMLAQLYERYYHQPATSLKPEQRSQYRQSLYSGNATLPYITSSGENATGRLSTTTGFITTIVPYESLEPEAGNGVYDFYDTFNNHYRYKTMGTDAKGNILGVIALDTDKSLSEFTNEQLFEMFLFHPVNVVKEIDQRERGEHPLLQILVRKLGESQNEFFVLDWNK